MFESEGVNKREKIVWREKVVRVLGGGVKKESKGGRGGRSGKAKGAFKGKGRRRGDRNVLKVIGQVKKNCCN